MVVKKQRLAYQDLEIANKTEVIAGIYLARINKLQDTLAVLKKMKATPEVRTNIQLAAQTIRNIEIDFRSLTTGNKDSLAFL